MCVVYFEMIRGKSKGGEKKESRWVGEEKAWENTEERG